MQFSSIIIEEGLGFPTLPSLLLTSASYLVQFFLVLLANGGSSYFRNSRTYWMIWNLVISMVGAAMIRELSAEQRWARYAGYCITLGFTANFPLVLAMVSGNFGGFTKKMTVNSMVGASMHDLSYILRALSLTSWQVFIAYCAGNIVGPQLFFAHEAPGYTSGFLAMMVCFAAGIVLCILLRVQLVLENRRRDKSGAGSAEDEIAGEISADLDKTDKEIPQFRYCY